MNSVNYFPIHRTRFFVALMALLVFALIMANNFFYYQSRDDLAQGTLRQVFNAISGQYESCLKSGTDTNLCKDILVKGIKGTWRSGVISLLDDKGKVILEIDREDYKEDRSVIVHIGSSGLDEDKVNFVLSKRSSPPLWKSSLRSMFLSFWEIPAQRDINYFFWNIAVKRSSPLFYSLITIGLLLWLVRQADSQKQRYYQRIEAENFIAENDLSVIRENLKFQQLKEAKLDERIKCLQEDESKLLKDYYREKDELHAAIHASKERESELIEKQTKTEKLLEKLKSRDGDYSKSSFKDLLLSNPSINMNQADFDCNPGDHHSKNYVKNIANALLRDPLAARLITKVNASEYQPTKQKVAVLEWNRTKNIFVLNVCNVYVAEVVLTTNAAESSFIAKYLLSGKNYLAKEKFTLKIGTLS